MFLNKRSIPILADKGMVGKVMLSGEIVFAEERENLFPISLTGATIQDSGTRERRDVSYVPLHCQIIKRKKY